MPERREALSMLGLVGSLSFVQILIKIGQLTIGKPEHRLTLRMRGYADEKKLDYSKIYVLNGWERNRFYNSLVKCNSQSCVFAKKHYRQLATTQNGADWYEQFRDCVGFVVTEGDIVGRTRSLGARLHIEYGGGASSIPRLGHYRAIGQAGNGEKNAFTLVPGALVAAKTDANEGRGKTALPFADGETYGQTGATIANDWFGTQSHSRTNTKR